MDGLVMRVSRVNVRLNRMKGWVHEVNKVNDIELVGQQNKYVCYGAQGWGTC